MRSAKPDGQPDAANVANGTAPATPASDEPAVWPSLELFIAWAQVEAVIDSSGRTAGTN